VGQRALQIGRFVEADRPEFQNLNLHASYSLFSATHSLVASFKPHARSKRYNQFKKY
jgi:hypothetical protein